MAGLDRVNRQSGSQHLLALDQRRLTEIRRGAEVLDGVGEFGGRGRGGDRELRFRLRHRGPAERAHSGFQGGHVLGLLRAEGLQQRGVGAAEQFRFDHLRVERGLQILERERVVEDPDVTRVGARGRGR